MYEVDFFAVGEGERSGDAIALRYTIPGRAEPIVGVIDAGFLSNGEELVEHIPKYYGTDRVDFVLSTHPDGDHINGMGEVVRQLDVRCLLIHRPKLHGYASNTGSKPAEELTKLVEEKGGKVVQPFAGISGWNNSFVVAGPTEGFYKETLAEQTKTVKQAPRAPSFAERFVGSTVVKAAQKVLASFPVEIPFGDAGGDNPRNNSSAILSLMIDGKHLVFPGDAGVPALTAAMDHLDASVVPRIGRPYLCSHTTGAAITWTGTPFNGSWGATPRSSTGVRLPALARSPMAPLRVLRMQLAVVVTR
jgi:hypothetical protein